MCSQTITDSTHHLKSLLDIICRGKKNAQCPLHAAFSSWMLRTGLMPSNSSTTISQPGPWGSFRTKEGAER